MTSLSLLFPVSLPRRRRFALSAIGIGALVVGLSAVQAQTVKLTTLRTFNSAVEGILPYGPLTQGADGFYYGTLREGGNNDIGAVFRIKADGKNFSVLTSFPGTNTGAFPEGGLVQARDGNFYGTTFAGGDNGVGVLYRITPSGALTKLFDFTNGNPGANPASTLTLGLDGFLYGTAEFGGSANFGTVYRVSVSDGAVTALSSFKGDNDGIYPLSDLIQAEDGGFYGTTTRGGNFNAGTLFRISNAGDREIIYNFNGNGDGAEPWRGVTQGEDGNFYGVTHSSGIGSGGTIYRVTPNGSFTRLNTFLPLAGDGYDSFAGLLLASDGNFYGVSHQGGFANAGTIFRITPDGDYTLLYSFTNGVDGGYPRGTLIQGSDGNLYGATAGINGQFSTVFKCDLDLPVPTPSVVLFQPASVKAGDTVVLQGKNFIGATKVTFRGANGTTLDAASFTVRAKGYLEAVVPDGAVSGKVTVTANEQSGDSATSLSIGSGTPPVEIPVVTLAVQDPVASEGTANMGVFKIKRTGNTTSELTVLFTIGKKSTAVRGVDFNLAVQGQVLPAVVKSVTIPAGKAAIGVRVVAIDDDAVESDETVIFTLKAGSDYTLGTPIKGQVVIADNE